MYFVSSVGHSSSFDVRSAPLDRKLAFTPSPQLGYYAYSSQPGIFEGVRAGIFLVPLGADQVSSDIRILIRPRLQSSVALGMSQHNLSLPRPWVASRVAASYLLRVRCVDNSPRTMLFPYVYLDGDGAQDVVEIRRRIQLIWQKYFPKPVPINRLGNSTANGAAGCNTSSSPPFSLKENPRTTRCLILPSSILPMLSQTKIKVLT